LKIKVFRNGTLCCVPGRQQRYEEIRCLHCQRVTVPFYPGRKGEKSFPCSRLYTRPIRNIKYRMEVLTYIHQILNFRAQNYTYNTVLTMFYITNTDGSRTMSYGNFSSVITAIICNIPTFLTQTQ
jgi:hypothetical protein